MKKIVYILIISLGLVGLLLVIFPQHIEEKPAAKIQNKIIKNNVMKLNSSVFENYGNIPSKYTCDGENINPPLEISEVPVGTKSFVLIMDDPDAVKPAGKVWDHWIVFNIPSSETVIKEGEEPSGVHGSGTGGNSDYYGPCPPDGEHRYFFKVYALDIDLDLSAGATKPEVEAAMADHILAKAELVGLYKRK